MLSLANRFFELLDNLELHRRITFNSDVNELLPVMQGL